MYLRKNMYRTQNTAFTKILTHTHCGTSLMDTVFQNFAEEFGGQESQRQNLKIISIPYYQPDQMGPYMCSTICPKSVLSTINNIFVV